MKKNYNFVGVKKEYCHYAFSDKAQVFYFECGHHIDGSDILGLKVQKINRLTLFNECPCCESKGVKMFYQSWNKEFHNDWCEVGK